MPKYARAFNQLATDLPVELIHERMEDEMKLAAACAINADRLDHYALVACLATVLLETLPDVADFAIPTRAG